MSNYAVRRVLVAISVVAASLGVSTAMATPASANSSICKAYLHDKGYKIGPKVDHWCKEASRFHSGEEMRYKRGLCIHELRRIEVRSGHARKACTLAQR